MSDTTGRGLAFGGRGRGRGSLLREEDQVQEPGLGRAAAPPAAPIGVPFIGLGRGRGRGSLLPEGAQAAPPLVPVVAHPLAPAVDPVLPPPAMAPAAGPVQIMPPQMPGAALPAQFEDLQIGQEDPDPDYVGRGVCTRGSQASGSGRGRGRGGECQVAGTSGSASHPQQSPVYPPPLQGMSDPYINPSLKTKLSSGPHQPVEPVERPPVQVTPPVPYEPMRGTSGTNVNIETNFIRMNIAEGKGYFEYHVDFVPEFDSIQMCRKIVGKMTEFGPTKNFDGAKLCLPEKLSSDIVIHEVDHPTLPGEKVRVTTRFVRLVPPHESAHHYNILLRKVLEFTELKEINRNFFDPQNIFNLPQHRLEVWSGYDSAVDYYDGGIMVCIETIHRVLQKTTTLEYLRTLKNTIPDFKERFREAIVGRSILTRYNNKFYKVDDIDWNLTPRDTFMNRKTGDPISYLDYFSQHWGQNIIHMDQPMLVSRIKPRKNDPLGETKIVNLVPELSYLTGLTDEITSNFSIMKELIAHTRIMPGVRRKKIEEFIQRLKKCEPGSQLLESWGLSFDPAPVKVTGRLLACAPIKFNDRATKTPHPRNFDENAFAKQSTSGSCLKPVGYEKWYVFTPQNEVGKAMQMVDMMKGVAPLLGITFTPPEIVTVTAAGRMLNGVDYAKCIKEKTSAKQPQFIMILLAQQREELYASVKKQVLVNSSIPSQVMLTRTLSNERRLRSIMQKVVLQINCKLGGALWALDLPKTNKIMFVGIDAYHDPKRKHKSVIAMVASMDNGCTEHFSKVRFQTPHQEGSAVIGVLFKECLAAFCATNSAHPDRVIVYRDGVGDGQMKELKVQEIEPIQQVLKEICGKIPKFSFVVVQKRINERMFLPVGGQLQNPDPGTVVDHTITRYHKYDFFLVSQLVRQGTVGPSHYTVLEDSDERKPDLIQRFTYALCYMYYNWPGSIRAPAPCQYAHKLAYLVGQHLFAAPQEEADNKLYYL